MAAEYLSTLGIIITVDGKPIEGAKEFDDIGGEAEGLDATVLTDTQTRTIPGLKQQDAWTVTYNFNNNTTDADFRRLNKLVDAKKPVEIEVLFKDGTKLATKGIPGSNKVSGGSVNAVLEAVVSFNVQDEWKPTNPSTTM